MTILHELSEFGQSAWLDNINRKLIKSGRLKELIDIGLSGLTSNPTIFDNAISKSTDYDDLIGELLLEKKSISMIYDAITIRDIREAADLFMPVYERTDGNDGYVSLEINPKLARDCSETIKEGKRLYEKIKRPNLMLKVPATNEGFMAIEDLIAEGININVTLIFSVKQYEKTAETYLSGVEKLFKKGGNLGRLHSVASIFVSRIDTAVDKLIDELISSENPDLVKEKLNSLKGKAAVANSLLIYKKHREIFSSTRFSLLKDKGANYQRVLWASTSTKNPAYRDIKYVEELLIKNTVNTMPEDTLKAFIDHGRIQNMPPQTKHAQDVINNLKNCGIHIERVCNKLLDEGVLAFEKSFVSLLSSIEAKAKKLSS